MLSKFKPADLVKDLSYNSLKGMKITFINMPLRESACPNTPPEGPGILAAISRKYGSDAYLIDLNGYRIKDEAAKKRGLPNYDSKVARRDGQDSP